MAVLQGGLPVALWCMMGLGSMGGSSAAAAAAAAAETAAAAAAGRAAGVAPSEAGHLLVDST